MKKLFFIIPFLLSLNNAFCQTSKQVFESPNLKEVIASHKQVAIIPFTATITYRHTPKGVTAESNLADERKMAKEIQSSMYTYLLRRAKDYSVDFQEVDKTNILLTKAGLMDKLGETTSDELAKALGVDAIISGIYAVEHTKTEGGAIASVVLFGAFAGGDKTGTLTMKINDGKDGSLLWRFAKSMEGSLFTSTDDLISHMMRKVSRNFPYLR